MEHLEANYNVHIEEDWSDCKGLRFKEASKDGHIYYGIWLRGKADLTTLVHELLHLVYAIFIDREIKVNAANQETVAYYLAYWFDKIKPIMTSRKKNKSKKDKANGRKR
jgi:hypothetical protein